MKDDNTPGHTSRRRRPTPHMRLRKETSKKLQALSSRAKAKRARSKKQDPVKEGSEGAEQHHQIPQVKNNTLAGAVRVSSKFRKRQLHKSWLPTHIYHAKRAHITPPAQPLWRFAIPLSPTDKTYRKTHRAVSYRGCVAWDTSYMSTIRLGGAEASLLSLLRGLGVEESMLTGKLGAKWRRGTRAWDGWIHESDGEKVLICETMIVWCLVMTRTETEQEIASKEKEARQMFFRVHASAFLQVWKEVLKLAYLQQPAVVIEDLRFEMGSIEVTGPGSTEALVGVLSPIPMIEGASSPNIASEVWPLLSAVTNPASLPPNSLLGFEVTDPRLRFPPRTVKQPDQANPEEALLQILSSWPPDTTQRVPAIFDRSARFIASKRLASQKAINRRKGGATPGAYPDPLPEDPRIPVLLVASRSPTTGCQGSWSILLPWKCVLPVWYSLMYYPLSSGGNPLFGGLQEKRQILFEQRAPWFPGDFPGTNAGWDWEMMEREKRKAEWEKRPKGKRIQWDSVDVGGGKKGEIGIGWACDWERLFQGPPAKSSPPEGSTADLPHSPPEAENPAGSPTSSPQPPENLLPLISSNPTPESTTSPKEPPPAPPLKIQYIIDPASSGSIQSPLLATALSTVSISLLSRGCPSVCARIYRLPSSSTNPTLRTQWLALAQWSSSSSTNPSSTKHHPKQRPFSTTPTAKQNKKNKKDFTPQPHHERQSQLAASLLAGTTSSLLIRANLSFPPPKAGHVLYPSCPGEEDLVGFVTTGNFNLGEGRATAVGCVALSRVWQEGRGYGSVGEGGGGGGERRLCIVRDSGQSVGRLALWEFMIR